MQSQSLHLSGYRTGDKVIKIQVYIIRYTSGLGLHTGFALNSFLIFSMRDYQLDIFLNKKHFVIFLVKL